MNRFPVDRLKAVFQSSKAHSVSICDTFQCFPQENFETAAYYSANQIKKVKALKCELANQLDSRETLKSMQQSQNSLAGASGKAGIDFPILLTVSIP